MAKFLEVFEDITKLGTKIPTDEYLEYGKYPIVDQGQAFISGYRNDEAGLFSDVPVIIFGDHTRVLKYVDMPCFLGADGVKLLKAKDSSSDYKYLYYALCSARIPNTGYNRHFKWLKEVDIPLPPLETQKQIAANLDKVTHTIDLCNAILEKLDLLVKARFVEMFGGLTDTVPLSHYIKALTAGKSLAGEEECQNKVLKTGAATYDYFDETQVKNLPVDYTPLAEHQIHDGDVIISRMNTAELVGAAAYIWKAPDNTYLPDRLWRAELKEKVNPIFVWQVIIQSSTKEGIRRIAGGTSGSMKNISKPGLLGVNVIKVSLDQQNQFAAFVSQTNKSKLAVQKLLAKAETLKKALMQEYFG